MYRVILRHVGTKRGGWNVEWYLETRESDFHKGLYKQLNLLPVKEAIRLGFEKRIYPAALLGPFGGKEEAIKKAQELGLEVISIAKLRRLEHGKLSLGNERTKE